MIDELRSANLTVMLPLDLPNEDDLIDIEEQLFIALGADLRSFLLTVSDVIYGSLEPVTAADPNSSTYILEVAASAWDEGLSREWIPICATDEGYYYTDEQGVIGYWQAGEVTGEHWDSIWEWSRDVWLMS